MPASTSIAAWTVPRATARTSDSSSTGRSAGLPDLAGGAAPFNAGMGAVRPARRVAAGGSVVPVLVLPPFKDPGPLRIGVPAVIAFPLVGSRDGFMDVYCWAAEGGLRICPGRSTSASGPMTV